MTILLVICGLICEGQMDKKSTDSAFAKAFYHNFKFGCDVSDSEKISSIFLFEMKIDAKGAIEGIKSWSKEKWCGFAAFYDALNKADKNWLAANANTTVLVPIMIMWDNPDQYVNWTVVSEIDDRIVSKFQALGNTKFLRPLQMSFLTKSIIN